MIQIGISLFHLLVCLKFAFAPLVSNKNTNIGARLWGSNKQRAQIYQTERGNATLFQDEKYNYFYGNQSKLLNDLFRDYDPAISAVYTLCEF